jgi:hypothetical protein
MKLIIRSPCAFPDRPAKRGRMQPLTARWYLAVGVMLVVQKP